jgi:DNA invertase Pin-like site-specific DNA recombinase
MRVSIYARYSTDLQRETSLEDQIAVARRYAREHGWHVVEECIFTDAGISGGSVDGRHGLQALLVAAGRDPRPFDVLLVDDSSRIARDLADAIRVMQQLRFFGVRVLYLSQGIDSDHEQAESLIAMHGLIDSLYLRELAKKTKRGLAGQLERGFSTGGRIYGYRTVAVVDPSGRCDPNGQPALLGKRLEVDPAEALIVVRIFTQYAEGCGVPTILRRLNQNGVAAPRGQRLWAPNAVRRMLGNERYRGVQIWGQRTWQRVPTTNRKVARAVPRADWCVKEQPHLRIVSEDLWQRVQDRRAYVKRAFGIQTKPGGTLVRGRSAVLHSPHLFGGLMTCAVCGGPVAIVSGGKGSPRYGCARAHRVGPEACTNGLTIRAKVADPILLSGLRAALLEPDTLRYVTDALGAALNRVLNERPRLRVEAQAKRDTASRRLANLVRAVAEGGAMPTLLEAIARHETDVRAADDELASLLQPVEDRMVVMPAWVRQQLSDLAALLSQAPERTKTELLRLNVHVALEPASEGGRAFLRANGTGDLASLTLPHSLPSALRGLSDPR